MIEMDWKQQAVQALKSYKLNKQSIENLRERIQILSAQLEGVSSPGGSEGAGGGRERDEMYCDVIGKIDNLRMRLDIIQRDVRLTEQGLAALDAAEREALTVKYINGEYNSIMRICERLHVERTKAYTLCDNALKHFSAVLFGSTGRK